MNYIQNPVTEADFINNIKFNFENVRGYIAFEMYSEARIKSASLLSDLEAFEKFKTQKNKK